MKDELLSPVVRPKAGWQERVEKLAQPSKFVVDIDMMPDVYASLSPNEIARMQRKLKLVQRAARYLAAGMLKGTIKYEHEESSLREWLSQMVEESGDVLNYAMLALATIPVEKNGGKGSEDQNK